MSRTPSAIISAIAVLGFGIWITDLVHAQNFPSRNVKLVVPFPAGGPNDTTARLVAQGLSVRLGQAVIVENQAGAGGTIGTRQVVAAAADGHTLLMIVPTNTFGTAPLLYKLDYDPMKALVPVATVAVDKVVMAVIPSIPVSTVDDLVRHSKANPRTLNYGSAIGTAPYFIAELFKLKTGADIVHVPYRGGSPMIADLLGGRMQVTVNTKSAMLQLILEGKLHPLAVAGAERWRELPDVPTLIESGYMDAPFDTLLGIAAPSTTPAETIETINRAVNGALRSTEIRESFAKIGLEPKLSTPQEFAATIAIEAPRWAKVVEMTRARPN